MQQDQVGKAKYSQELDATEMLTLIFDYAGKIANERNLDQLLTLMMDMGKQMILADRCTVWLYDQDKEELWTKVAHGVEEIRMPAGSGLVGYAVATGEPVFIPDAYQDERFNQAIDLETGYRTKAIMVIPFRNNEGEIIGAYQAINKLTAEEVFSEKDMEYLTLAASYCGKSLESALLQHEIEETQKEIIFRMGEIGELRSKETGYHVKRVAEYSYLLALGVGLSEEEAELLRIASPMHDIGKVAIPDHILNKPGKLTDEEFRLMQSHTTLGHSLLKNSKRRIIQAAAIVAYQHHEKWNGKGYPQGLKGEEIHIFGRITALADVFDALASDRVYKKAWELDKVLKLIREESGQHFDPQVVESFFANLPQLLEVREQYSDLNLERNSLS